MNPYGGLPMEQAEFNRYGGTLLSPVMGIMNPLKPPFKGTPATISKMLQEATQTINANPAAGEVAVYIRQKYNPNVVPSTEGNRVAEAIGTCEAVKTVNCAAFRDPNFARNCVMAHEPATNSKGEKQIGGIVLFREDRISQANAAKGRIPAYKATIGSLPLGAVSVDEESCNAMSETVACRREKNFASPNCASCQDGQGNWNRVGPKAVREAAKLVLIGAGTYTFSGGGVAEQKGRLSSAPTEIELPAAAEGLTFTLKVGGVPEVKVGGYLEGQTPNGSTKTDLTFLATYDNEGGARPRIIGYEMLGDEPVNTIRPLQGKNGVSLQIYMPFTFLASTEEAANLCPTAPYSTKEESMKLLASDPCYSSRGGPPSLECLQGRFVAAGCTTSGKGYPGTETAAQALRTLNGQQQTVGQISQRVAAMATSAQTGRAADGSKLSLEAWNEASQFCFGKTITSPCAAYDTANGPLGDDCIAYLYAGGSAIDKPGSAPNPIGRTYTLPTNKYSSLTAAGLPAQCTKEGTASPMGAALETARKLGGVTAVQKYFDNIHRRANDNSLPDEARKEAIRQCYGVQMAAEVAPKAGQPLVKSEPISLRDSRDNAFFRHTNFILRKQNNDGSQLFREDATFMQKTPLCGLPGFTSLEATNFPNYYVVAEGSGAAIRPRQKTAAYEDSACWKMLPRDGGRVMLESQAAPGKYLISRGSDVYLTAPTSSADRENAIWNVAKPLSQVQQMGPLSKAQLVATNQAITNACPIPGFGRTTNLDEAVRLCQANPDCTDINFLPKAVPFDNVVLRNCKGFDKPPIAPLNEWQVYNVKR